MMTARYRSMLRTVGKRLNSTLAAQYTEYGKARDVLKLVNLNLESDFKNLQPDEVILKHLLSPINPSDINMVGGVYGVKPPGFPAIGGTEGVAVVQKVGSAVTGLKPGDWVIPHAEGIGMWVQESKVKEAALLKVPNDIAPAEYVATVAVNPSTAYRLLRDFESLKPGDVIVQNGANSMVGYAVIQLARHMGVRTINIIRGSVPRPRAREILHVLWHLGGTVNVTDEYLNDKGFQEILADLPPIKLALNCVGGDSATELSRLLSPGGTLVTYGGMSNHPVTLPLDLVAEKQLKLRGFWIAQWIRENSKEARLEMIRDLLQKVGERQMSFFFQRHDFDDFQWALEKSQEPYVFRKVLLDLNFPDRMAMHDELTDENDYWIFDAMVI